MWRESFFEKKSKNCVKKAKTGVSAKNKLTKRFFEHSEVQFVTCLVYLYNIWNGLYPLFFFKRFLTLNFWKHYGRQANFSRKYLKKVRYREKSILKVREIKVSKENWVGFLVYIPVPVWSWAILRNFCEKGRLISSISSAWN